jgi:ribosomal protein S18 acetylase RimI-like enzyme
VPLNAAMRAAELGEAEFMYEMFATAPADAREALGLAQVRLGGGEITIMAADMTWGFWSRAIGFGVDEPLTDEVLDDALAYARLYRAASLVFQVAPTVDGDWEQLLRERGATPGGTWVKFAGPADLHPHAECELRVDVLGPEHGTEFARVMCLGFGMPLDSALPSWFQGLPGQRAAGFTTYGAWDGAELVAAATLFIRHGIGTLSGAATLPEYRGRGAQGALMARRIRDASAYGCAWITAETGAETPENPNPSLHNMRRVGLTELYERRNWVWRAPA